MKLYPNLLPYEIRFDRCPCNGYDYSLDLSMYSSLQVITANNKILIQYGDDPPTIVIQFPYTDSDVKNGTFYRDFQCAKCERVPYRVMVWREYQSRREVV